MVTEEIDDELHSAKNSSSRWAHQLQETFPRHRCSPRRINLSPSASPEPYSQHADGPLQGQEESQRVQALTRRPWGPWVDQSCVDLEELVYPSQLHRIGRLMIMTVVTSSCIFRHASDIATELALTLAGRLRVELVPGGVLVHIPS